MPPLLIVPPAWYPAIRAAADFEEQLAAYVALTGISPEEARAVAAEVRELAVSGGSAIGHLRERYERASRGI